MDLRSDVINKVSGSKALRTTRELSGNFRGWGCVRSIRKIVHCEVPEKDTGASKDYRMVVLLPGSSGLRTNGREVSPSGLKPNSRISTRDQLPNSLTRGSPSDATAFVMLDLRLWDTHPIHFPIDRFSQHEFLGHNGYFKLVMSRFQHIEACFLDKMDFDW